MLRTHGYLSFLCNVFLSCTHRPVPCRHECGEVCRAVDVAGHEFICLERTRACTLGCGTKVSERSRHEHEEYECINRLQACPLGCGVKRRVRDIEGHLGKECKKRIVDCELGCKEVWRKKKLVWLRALNQYFPADPCRVSSISRTNLHA